MGNEYEWVRQYEIIEIIHEHILYVLHFKMENDASLKERFKWNKIGNDAQSVINAKLDKIQNNLLNDDDDNAIMDKIQRSLLDALKFLANQLYRSNSSKLRHKRSSKTFENDKAKDKEQKLKIYHECEEYVLCKLMDFMYERINICCDLLNSQRGIRPSAVTLIESNFISSPKQLSKSKKRSKSKSISSALSLMDSQRVSKSQLLNTKIEDVLKKPICILSKEISLGDKSPNRQYIDTTKQNLLIQGRYTAFSKANALQSNSQSSLLKTDQIKQLLAISEKERKEYENKNITLYNSFDAPSVVYNFSISFWIKPRNTKIMKCGWAKQLIYRGSGDNMHPAVLCCGSHPTISASFTVIPTDDKKENDVVEVLCPLPAKTNDCFDNEWFFVAVTLNNNKVSIVINGEYCEEKEFEGRVPPPPTQFYNVGKLVNSAKSKTQLQGFKEKRVVSGHVFDGNLKDLQHHFIPLSMEEIKEMYLQKKQVENYALDSFHFYGYKSLHLLTNLFMNHSLLPPFFFAMDGMQKNETTDDEEPVIKQQENDDYDAVNDEEKTEVLDEEKQSLPIEDLAKLTMDSRKQISSHDSSKWFALLFKIFKFGTMKMRREVMILLKQILKNKFSQITLEHLSFALGMNSESVLDEIMESVICSIWTKEYGLNIPSKNEDSLEQIMENDRDLEYALNSETKTSYSSYLNSYKASNIIDSDIDSSITAVSGCQLFSYLWHKQENKDVIDAYITKTLKARLDDNYKKQRHSSALTPTRKSYAQSIATKSVSYESAQKNEKTKQEERVKFLAVLHLLNGHILRLLPYQLAYESNKSAHLPMLTLNRGQISRIMTSSNNATFYHDSSRPQHLSMDSLIPIPYLDSSFIEQCSNQCFNVVIKGIGTAISKLFTRFVQNDIINSNPNMIEIGASSSNSSPTQQLIVSRVCILMINALNRALDPMFNDEATCFNVFTRIVTSSHFNALCSKILSLSKNIIPSEIKIDENDILPTIIGENTAMIDLGYLEKYVQMLQSYVWTNKHNERSANNKKKSNKKKKAQKKANKKKNAETKVTYNWPSGPQNCSEAESVKHIFTTYRGKKKALICQLCRQQPLGGNVTYSDIYCHFVVRHNDLLEKHIDLNAEFKKLRDSLDGGDAADNAEDASVDPRFKNLNQEYVQNLALMGFPIEWCQFALAECANDINAASDWLLNHLDNIEELMRQKEEARLQEKRKKLSDKKRKAAQFQMECTMQYDEIKQFGKRAKKRDYLDIFSPMNIVKKSGNKNVYETISNNDTYSMNDFGKKYKARNTFRSLNVPDLLSRITEKYSFNQIQKLLARAQFYLATMYSRKLISMLLYHSHSIRHLNLLPFDKNQLIKEEKISYVVMFTSCWLSHILSL